MTTVEATRAKERRGIHTALCAPVLALGNLWVVGGAWGPVTAVAGICLVAGIGIIIGANGDQTDGPENPNVTRLLTNASIENGALMAEMARLKQRCDVLQDENETLARRLDSRMSQGRMSQEPDVDVVIRQAFGLATTVMGCKTCHESGCAACDRHAWVAREEDQGWPSM